MKATYNKTVVADIPASVLGEVAVAYAEKGKIEAIKLFRIQMGCSLLDAKKYVEESLEPTFKTYLARMSKEVHPDSLGALLRTKLDR